MMGQYDTQNTLSTIFGYAEFRPLQHEVINNVLNGNDTLVIMPTGGGKSLCYQLPALLWDGLTVVVSPLIALMQDQVTQLHTLGVDAVYLNSSLDSSTYRENIQKVRNGTAKMLYVAPETLVGQGMLHVLDECNVSALVIDEAHCISQWGHDFRPEYRQLMTIRYRYPKAVCMALTATATPRVQEDIRQTLQFGEKNAFVASFDRPNLNIGAMTRTNAVRQIQRVIDKHKGESGIIYCNTRKRVDEVYDILRGRGIKALPYHGGMDSATRSKHQTQFIRDDADVMIATIAFGMGINKPDVRYVLHYDMPNSMEQYYQQIGRAGRDGLPSDCLLLFSQQDVNTHLYHIQKGAETESRGRQARLETMVAWSESPMCRRKALLSYFGELEVNEKCDNCDNCAREDVELVDLTVHAQKFLSCVYRTEQKFGMAHIVDVLRGSVNERVRKWDHDKIKTHGAGKDVSAAEWKRLGRQFVQRGLLKKNLHGGLELTGVGVNVLTGKELFMGAQAVVVMHKAAVNFNYDRELYTLLRSLTKRMADEKNIPPYMVFNDRSLQEMATFFPHSLDTFGRVHGVGRNKLDQYANPFIKAITSYCTAHNITEKQIERTTPSATRTTVATSGIRHIAYGDRFNTGKTVSDLAAEFDVKERTVVSNLRKYAEDGNMLNEGLLRRSSGLTIKSQDAVIAKYAELGDERLRPLFDAFHESISYDILALMRIVYRQSHADSVF